MDYDAALDDCAMIAKLDPDNSHVGISETAAKACALGISIIHGVELEHCNDSKFTLLLITKGDIFMN